MGGGPERRRTAPPWSWVEASGAVLQERPPAFFLLLLVQPVKLTAEAVKVLAYSRKPVDLQELEPEPLGLFGLFNKQLADVGRVHVHLPFLDTARAAAVRWAGAAWPGLAPNVADGRAAVKTPKTVPPVPL